MPRLKLTKSAIDALPTPAKDIVYWDGGCPGFGVKITPKGRKVFIVMCRLGGAGSRLRKYTIGPYGRVTLPMARAQAQRIFAAPLDGRDPAEEKKSGPAPAGGRSGRGPGRDLYSGAHLQGPYRANTIEPPASGCHSALGCQ